MPRCPICKAGSRVVRGVALLSTLAVLTVAAILLITFVTLVQTDWTATLSYSQALKADQLAQGSLQLVVRQLQAEMAKDALPDTGDTHQYPGAPVYTNVGPANLLPQLVGTNAAMPLLVKTSTTNAPFSGSLASGVLIATPVSAAAKSLNGRTVSTNRWDKPRLGAFPNNDAVPCWIVMTRGGPAATNSTPIFGPALAGALNNSSPENSRFAIGRVAYAVYNEGGLLDISVAGHPNGFSTNALQQLKGSLAGADLSVLGIDADKLSKWRNAASALSVSNYAAYVTSYLATNGSRAVYQGDTTFLSRQDLIEAADRGVAGLTAASVTNLTTFTREKDAPTWGPSYDAVDLGGSAAYPYRAASYTATATNRFVPLVRFAASGTVTGYHSDGTSYTYAVTKGDPLLGHRFPLDRLAWIGASGPQNGGTAQAIQACFGLVWGPSADPKLNNASVWKYVGPAPATAPQKPTTTFKTLDQVAAETPPREPNFFELLQAGILNGSLGVANLKTYQNNSAILSSGAYQAFTNLQILRIGANLIDQYDDDSCPTVIEYNQSATTPGVGVVQAVGVENLPGVNLVTPAQGVPPTTTQDLLNGAPTVTTQAFLMFHLWNPNQQPAALPKARPDVRLHVAGSFTIGSALGDSSILPKTALAGRGYDLTLDDTIQLSSGAGFGVNGFTSGAKLVTTADVVAGSYAIPTAAAPVIGATPAGKWANTYALGGDTTAKKGPSTRTDLLGYRLPDFPLSYAATTAGNAKTDLTWWIFGSSTANLFNAYLEFKTPSGDWIPYQYLTGTGDPLTWIKTAYVAPGPNNALAIGYTATGGIVAAPLADLKSQVPSEPTGTQTNWRFPVYPTMDVCPLLFGGGDPRSIRFNIWEYSDRSYIPAAVGFSYDSTLWTTALVSASSSSRFYYAGIGGDQNSAQATSILVGRLQYSPNLMGNVFYPAQLARNNFNDATALSGSGNSTSGGPTPGGSANPDTTTKAAFNTSYQDNDGLRRIADSGIFTDTTATVGNPFFRAADKPVILNRAFNSVAEMGYAFRDDPWRSLDFFSRKSADAGLLDLFSLHDAATVSASGRLSVVRHGTIDLNSRSSSAVAALLSTTLADTVGGTATIGKPSALASALVSFSAPGGSDGGPLANKADLALRFVSSALPLTVFGDADEQGIKARREAPVRALADVGQTRTWNLLIDLVAQTGQYIPTATSLDQFTVDGERRYWLHIAIDRFTGEIVEQKLEPVSE